MGDQRGVAISLNNLALIAHYQEDYARAIDLFQQSIALFEALGDVRVKSAVLSNLGRALTGQGEYSQATDVFAPQPEHGVGIGQSRG